MRKIILIRHTSVATAAGICYGQTDVPLADSFEQEAAQVFEQIKDKTFDAVFSSPLSRCLKLAEYCGFSNPTIDDRLMELNFGNWEMQAWDNITDSHLTHWYADWINEKPTNGESFFQMTERVKSFLEFIQNSDFKHVAIFTHAGVLRSANVILRQIPLNEAFTQKIDHGHVEEMEVRGSL